MQAYVYSGLYRSPALSQINCLPRRAAVEGEGVVAGVCYVAAPQLQACLAEVYVGMRPQKGVERLAVCVGLVPVDAPLGRYVGAYHYRLYGRAAEPYAVVGPGVCRVHGDKGHALSVVAYLRVAVCFVILFKRGTR